MKEPPDKQNSIVARSHRQAEAEGGVGSALQAALNKAPTRLCVTAPSGDRSLSYIHQRNPAVTRTELRAGTAARASEEEKPTSSYRDLPEEEQEDCLSLAISEQLADWQASSPLRTIQEEVVALDPALKGTISQSQITQAFLRHEVPLKLPTFRQLLLTFCDADHPDQVGLKLNITKEFI
ncbi:uncharacterized protein C1orf87 [Coregonus clupeaformis]|uniref:uncharacterized protein C1orf87 n=1 Tax=Coregonus clupeaformis TaxID=59861 RepID=UPI001BE012BF|nr:uncharacterized protein C1orf87 [Coregonus clupeaformis]